MPRRIGSCVKCVDHEPFVFPVLTRSISSLQPLALWSSVFLVVNWAVNAATIPGPILLLDKIFVFGVRKCSQYSYQGGIILCSLYSRLRLPALSLSLYLSFMTGHVTVQYPIRSYFLSPSGAGMYSNSGHYRFSDSLDVT